MKKTEGNKKKHTHKTTLDVARQRPPRPEPSPRQPPKRPPVPRAPRPSSAPPKRRPLILETFGWWCLNVFPKSFQKFFGNFWSFGRCLKSLLKVFLEMLLDILWWYMYIISVPIVFCLFLIFCWTLLLPFLDGHVGVLFFFPGDAYEKW